ncbi:MAG TPA: transposase [Polyangiales bacterium]
MSRVCRDRCDRPRESDFYETRRPSTIVDNYGIHKAHAVERVLASFRGRIVLHFLPPYCPDHNRIERVWLDLHANVTRNHKCTTMAQLLGNARRYVDAYLWHADHAQRVPLRIAA